MAKIDYHREKIEKPKTTQIKSIVGETYLNNFKYRFNLARKHAIENHKTILKARDMLLGEATKPDDSKLHLVVGEDIPLDAPEEFNKISLYVRDEEDNLNLYADISLPYLINHSEFLDIENDPRYFFKEGYNPETKSCKYICEIKPLGTMKGIYRILNGQSIKIGDIEPLYELENNTKAHTHTLKQK